MDDYDSDSDSDFESDMKEYVEMEKMVTELRESTRPRRESIRTRYNRKMLEMEDDEEHRTPIQVIREIMKEEEEEKEDEEEMKKRKQAEQEIEKVVAERDYDSIKRKHEDVKFKQYRQEATPFSWPFDYTKYRKKDLDAIDPFLSSKSSLKNDVAVVLKRHAGNWMSKEHIQTGLYLVHPKDFTDRKELWNSTYKRGHFDFSKTRTIVPIKIPLKRTSIFIWTRCAQKRVIEEFLLCCLKGMSALSPRVRALIANFIVSVKKSRVISSFTSYPKKPYRRNTSSYSSYPEMYVMFEHETREYLFSFNYSEYSLVSLTQLSPASLICKNTTRMLRKYNSHPHPSHSQEYDSNVTKVLNSRFALVPQVPSWSFQDDRVLSES